MWINTVRRARDTCIGAFDDAAMIRLHYGLLRGHFSEPRAADMLLRKFGTWYARGLRNAAAVRRLFQAIRGPVDVERILELIVLEGWHHGFRPFDPHGERDAAPETCGEPAAEPAERARGEGE